MDKCKQLPTKPLTNVQEIQQPESKESLDTDSPAREILTDFKISRPLMIEHSVTVSVAKELMTRAHVRLKLVIDKEEHFKGVISSADLMSIKVMQARERTGLSLEDLTVDEVMTHKDALHAVDITQFQHATIGDILLTMKTFGDHHVLVLDSTQNCIRGILSSSDIARALHESVYIGERASSFADIYNAIRN